MRLERVNESGSEQTRTALPSRPIQWCDVTVSVWRAHSFAHQGRRRSRSVVAAAPKRAVKPPPPMAKAVAKVRLRTGALTSSHTAIHQAIKRV
jgi:hypothetical protein